MIAITARPSTTRPACGRYGLRSGRSQAGDLACLSKDPVAAAPGPARMRHVRISRLIMVLIVFGVGRVNHEEFSGSFGNGSLDMDSATAYM